ncbi:MAG: Na+/H+ antiporter NhaC family protein [Bacteroidetes bacterium]|nr:Na+/H+ antiporter NhaC family protein [Bacteroidota bacterium]
MSILPPLVAILMALFFREVISSLFLGIFIGTGIIHFYLHGITGIFSGFLAVLDTYILKSLENWDHLSIIIFSMIIGSMVTVISKNGGMQGVVDKISVYAKTALSGQITTYFLGIVIFFDDYANTLVVGNTMRPVTDRLNISREKLSYIVDSTAAPIAAIAFVTTWIGAQLGYIKDSIGVIDGLDESAYSVFINSLQFAFYPIFTLFFILVLILKARDFGPMLKAERRARGIAGNSIHNTLSGDNEELASLEPVKGITAKWYNAVIPVLVVIFGTIAGLLYTGWDTEIWNDPAISLARKISHIIGNANSYHALLWSSLSGLATAVILTLSQRIMDIHATMESMMKGFKTMLGAVMILVLAWSLALVTEDMHTANFITGIMLSVDVNPIFIPAITFILAALVAFSTGSSWGTMAILYPLMLPATWYICMETGLSEETTLMIFYNVVSTVLAGSVLGDHSSPISDTTILSSLASSCNHIEHVRTQLPYALTVGAVAMVFGTIPGAMGVSSYITFPFGFLILFLIVHFFGKSSEKA